MFSRYAAAGVTVWLTVQALINLGCVLRLLPIAGVPLPLVSYGGSALLAALAGVGVLLVSARNEPEARSAARGQEGTAAPRMTTVIGSRTGPARSPAMSAASARAGRRRHGRPHLAADRDRGRTDPAQRPASSG